MGINYTYLSPGTYIREIDLSARIKTVLSTFGGAVYESLRGPTDLTFYNSGRSFIEVNGNPVPEISHAHDCILAFMEESSNFLGKRVTNGALYGGTTYFIDRHSKNAPANGDRICISDYPIGRVTDFRTGAEAFSVLAFSGDLATTNVFTMDISDGDTLQTVSVPFTTNHRSTLNAIAGAISAALATFGSNAVVQVHNELSSTVQPYIIKIRDPEATTIFYDTPVMTSTGGNPKPNVYLDGQARLFDILAENPGSWNNNVGVKITGIDVGLAQRYTLTFSEPLITGNTFTVQINGRALTAVAFDTDSDQTLANIATAIAADPDVATATVTEVPGARNNDRNITVVAEVAAPGALSMAAAIVQNGASQASVLVRETTRGVAPTGEFMVEVYEKPTVTAFKERFICTLDKRVNGRAKQTLIDQQINLASGRSKTIRVIVPESSRSYKFKPTLYNGVWTIDKTINWLNGGDDGVAVLNAQIRDGWQAFRNREKVPATLFLNCGYTDPSVQQEMVALAEYRYDAFAILDMPSDKQQPFDAYNYRLLDINIDSSYGAIYTPDLQIADDNSDELRYIPPSGHVGAAYAYTERTAAVYYAPAGLRRGKLKRVRDLRVSYELGDRELLDPVGVNCIIDKPGYGPAIWGEETLQFAKSVLSSVHSRLLMNKVEVGYADALDYAALFDPNNTFTQYRAKQVGDRILGPIKRAEGIYNYEIVTDKRVNTDEVVEDDMMAVDVYVDITRTSKRILITSILTPKGANFSELIAERSGEGAS